MNFSATIAEPPLTTPLFGLRDSCSLGTGVDTLTATLPGIAVIAVASNKVACMHSVAMKIARIDFVSILPVC